MRQIPAFEKKNLKVYFGSSIDLFDVYAIKQDGKEIKIGVVGKQEPIVGNPYWAGLYCSMEDGETLSTTSQASLEKASLKLYEKYIDGFATHWIEY